MFPLLYFMLSFLLALGTVYAQVAQLTPLSCTLFVLKKGNFDLHTLNLCLPFFISILFFNSSNPDV